MKLMIEKFGIKLEYLLFSLNIVRPSTDKVRDEKVIVCKSDTPDVE